MTQIAKYKIQENYLIVLKCYGFLGFFFFFVIEWRLFVYEEQNIWMKKKIVL